MMFTLLCLKIPTVEVQTCLYWLARICFNYRTTELYQFRLYFICLDFVTNVILNCNFDFY